MTIFAPRGRRSLIAPCQRWYNLQISNTTVHLPAQLQTIWALQRRLTGHFAELMVWSSLCLDSSVSSAISCLMGKVSEMAMNVAECQSGLLKIIFLWLSELTLNVAQYPPFISFDTLFLWFLHLAYLLVGTSEPGVYYEQSSRSSSSLHSRPYWESTWWG